MYSEETLIPFPANQDGYIRLPLSVLGFSGDPALDLIDRMLTVDMEKRITIEECLEHPWTTQRELNPNIALMDSLVLLRS